MGRLLYSFSPTPLQISRKPSPFISQLASSGSPKLNLLPSLARPQLRRVRPISCKTDDPSLFSRVQSNASYEFPSIVSPRADSVNESTPGSNILKLIAIGALLPKERLIHAELLSSAWTGFFAGCLHTLSGPDHLAALAPLSIGRTRMGSAVVGALWGFGHDAGQVIFGLIFLLLKDQLQIEVIRTWGTRVVGLTLLVNNVPAPAPCVAIGNCEGDVSVYGTLKNPAIGKKNIGFATFTTGTVHGLQPDALMMVLPELALPSRLAGVVFLVMFLLGTIVAMGSYTVFIGTCNEALKDRVPRITEKLSWASSFIANALGIAIIISQFFGYSLY